MLKINRSIQFTEYISLILPFAVLDTFLSYLYRLYTFPAEGGQNFSIIYFVKKEVKHLSLIKMTASHNIVLMIQPSYITY